MSRWWNVNGYCLYYIMNSEHCLWHQAKNDDDDNNNYAMMIMIIAVFCGNTCVIALTITITVVAASLNLLEFYLIALAGVIVSSFSNNRNCNNTLYP